MLIRKRCCRINEPGHARFLTFSCYQRRPFLSKDRSRQWLIDAIGRARVSQSFHLWAYVIMPEHVHLLVLPTEESYSISRLLTAIKLSAAKRAVDWVSRNAPEFLRTMEDRQSNGSVRYRFWQRGGGYDRNIVRDQTVWNEILYIHANPVRRGLCATSEDWQWSSALEYEQPGNGLLTLDKESLPTRVVT